MMEASRYAGIIDRLIDEIGGSDDGQDLAGELRLLQDEFVDLSSKEALLVVRLGAWINLATHAGVFSVDLAKDVLDQMYEQRSYR